jgi:hypothetical protein
MTDYVAAMNAGLCVLMAISDGVKPSPNDVKDLRRLAPEFADLPIDDLAFEIILRAASRGNFDRRRKDMA